MAQLLLISILSVLSFLCSAPLFGASDFSCKEVEVQSQVVKASEKSTLCFLRDDTYFISHSCADMNCQFITRLKQANPGHSEKERPGATMCRTLLGVVEEVKIPTSKLKIQRCLFVKEKASISLNLLESWNGKYFAGPSKPLKL